MRTGDLDNFWHRRWPRLPRAEQELPGLRSRSGGDWPAQSAIPLGADQPPRCRAARRRRSPVSGHPARRRDAQPARLSAVAASAAAFVVKGAWSPRSTTVHPPGRDFTSTSAGGCFPFPALLPYAPATGLAVDLGCGHGLLPFFLATERPALRLLGSDPDGQKIGLAQRVAQRHHIHNVEFVTALAQDTEYPECDWISLVDVLWCPMRRRRRCCDGPWRGCDRAGG